MFSVMEKWRQALHNCKSSASWPWEVRRVVQFWVSVSSVCKRQSVKVIEQIGCTSQFSAFAQWMELKVSTDLDQKCGAGWPASERGRGVQRSLWASGVLLFLVVSKALSEWRGKPAGCARRGAKSGVRFCAKSCFLGGCGNSCLFFVAKFARAIWAYDLQHLRSFIQISRLLNPKNSTPVFEPIFWVFPSCSPRTVPLLHGQRNKTHREWGPGVQQGYNRTSNETKKKALARKMCQERALVKWPLSRQFRGAEIEGVWILGWCAGCLISGENMLLLSHERPSDGVVVRRVVAKDAKEGF